MAFAQLYYTSCEHGLSGYPGYQFNAVTPGVTSEQMRTVESLTAYEPPRSLSYDSTPEEIKACPTNLCFSADESSIVANVVFVGEDYSHRFGNYFAHALVTTTPESDFDGVLPIELWQAPMWVRTPIENLELPSLDGPPEKGPLTREAVQEFIASHSLGRYAAALLSAVDRAVVDGDRSVLIVESTVDNTAYWIAAVSYLLPSTLTRRMSFATYHHRPDHSSLHVLGTTRDADIELEDAAEQFYLFDFAGLTMSTADTSPAANLLVRAGTVDAERLWRRLASLSIGEEDRLDSWHPVIAAAAALEDIPLHPVDVTAAARWLAAQAHRLEPGVRADLLAYLARLPSQTSWSPQEACGVLKALHDHGSSNQRTALDESPVANVEDQDYALGELLSRTLTQSLSAASESSDYLQLCQLLFDHSLRHALSPQASNAVARVEEATQRIQGQARTNQDRRMSRVSAEIVRSLTELWTDAPSPAQVVIGQRLSVLLGQIPTRELAAALVEGPQQAVEDYVASLRRAVAQTDPQQAARTFVAARMATATDHKALGSALDELLVQELSQWRRRDLDAILQFLQQDDPDSLPAFGEWRERHMPGGFFARKLRGRGIR